MPWQDFILPSRVAAKTKPELSQCLARVVASRKNAFPSLRTCRCGVVHDDEPGLKAARRWGRTACRRGGTRKCRRTH